MCVCVCVSVCLRDGGGGVGAELVSVIFLIDIARLCLFDAL